MAEWLSADFETRAVVDLIKAGVYKYAADPWAEVLCLAWALDDEPCQIWFPGEPTPKALVEHVLKGGKIRAFNATFERQIWWTILSPRHGFPKPALEQFWCTAAQAANMALPRDLDGVARVLKTVVQKDMEGYKLMKLMCKPTGYDDNGHPIWHDGPGVLKRLGEYCIVDVDTERAVGRMLFPLSETEREVYVMDQVINDRGILIDRVLVENALKVVGQAVEQLNSDLEIATDGKVKKTTQTGQIKAWLQANGVALESLNKATMADLLGGDLDASSRRAIELRRDAAKSSTGKLKTMLLCAGNDNRVRGTFRYYGAQRTGRHAGAGIQPQNFVRMVPKNADTLIEAVNTGSAAYVNAVYGAPMGIVSTLLRPCLIAANGHVLEICDFSNIESRVLAWLTYENRVLEVFIAQDNKTGPDVYCVTASDIYGWEINKVDHPEERQVGKVTVLALGFGGGVNAFAKMALNYNVDVSVPYAALWASSDTDIQQYVEKRYANATDDFGLSREGWIAAEIIKIRWRKANPNIVDFWKEVETAAKDAIANPGQVFSARRVKYVVFKSYLWCQLPSGRKLAYPQPHMRKAKTPWGDIVDAIHFWGPAGQARKWLPISTHGGKLVENITQAVARDLLMDAMLRAEKAGKRIILHAHDELVSETPEHLANMPETERLMCASPQWVAGCPISAEGKIKRRYAK